MKKITLVFICLVMARTGIAQSWNLSLNSVAGNPNFGTSNAKPIDFFTNNTKKMSLGVNGKLNIANLSGTGERFLKVDATGDLIPWTGSSSDNDKILFGNNTWVTFPFTIDGANLSMRASGAKLGINLTTPTAELDVAGSGKISNTLKVGGDIIMGTGFNVSVIAPSTGVPNTIVFRTNPIPSTPIVYTYKPPCNVWFKAPNPFDPPVSTTWVPPTNNVAYDLLQVYESNAQNSVLSMGILNGDGIIGVEPLPSSTAIPKLKLNPGCTADVYICEGGGYTRVAGDGSVGGTWRIGPGSYSPGSQLDVFLDAAATKAMTIVDPSITVANKNILEISKLGETTLGVDVQAIAGSMLSIGQPVKNKPGISLRDNSTTPNTSIFNVYGDGLTEITASSTKALSIMDASNSNSETFMVNKSGATEIKTSATKPFVIKNSSTSYSDVFAVSLNGLTEITANSTKALSIKDAANSNVETFVVNKNGATEIISGSNKAISIKNSLNSNNETFIVSSNGYMEIKVYSPSGMPAPYSSGARAFTVRDMSANGGSGKDIFVVNANGIAYAREIEISNVTNFPDYVFDAQYDLKPISEVEKYIKIHKHLSGFEKADVYETKGININSLLLKQQEKIEELTLYIIQLEKRLQSIESKN